MRTPGPWTYNPPTRDKRGIVTELASVTIGSRRVYFDNEDDAKAVALVPMMIDELMSQGPTP